MAQLCISLEQWLTTPLGQHFLTQETRYFDSVVANVFGFNAVQIGHPELDFLRNCRIPQRFHVGFEGAVAVRADVALLPFASQSIDLVVIPHTLEFARHPHQVLREVERILMPEGHLFISGFNPRSFWGARRWFKPDQREFPWSGHFIHLSRLKDWLSLLGMETEGGKMCCYVPPFRQHKWLQRFAFMEAAGDRWWAMGGGVYFIEAVKRVQGMRLITPNWREPASKSAALAPAARNVVNLNQYRKLKQEIKTQS